MAFNFLDYEALAHRGQKEAVVRMVAAGLTSEICCVQVCVSAEAALNHLGYGCAKIVGFSEKGRCVWLCVVVLDLGCRSRVAMRGVSLKCLVACFVTRIRGFSFEVGDGRSPREGASSLVDGISERESTSIRRVNVSIEYADSENRGQGMVVDVLRRLLTKMSGRSFEGAVVFAIRMSSVGSSACPFRGCGSERSSSWIELLSLSDLQ